MNENYTARFFKIFLYGAAGVLLGILLGFVFGLLISVLVEYASNTPGETPPRSVVTFLSMGLGALIGGIFGAGTVTKKK